MRFVALWAALGLMIAASVSAETETDQIVTTSWFGLSGLYVIPTARMIGNRNFAVGFNESQHSEFRNDAKYTDRQIRGVVTYGVTSSFEITATYFNDLFKIGAGEVELPNEGFLSVGLKVLLMKEHQHYWFPAVALGVRDLTNSTANVGPLKDVHNGRKFYLLASKRLLKNPKTGRFMDVHVGATYDHNGGAGLLGFELTLAPNASLIAEWMWDSPFLSFDDFGSSGQRGPFIFDTGLRIYPELIPGLVLDLGFVGDGEFEFSFGISYVAKL